MRISNVWWIFYRCRKYQGRSCKRHRRGTGLTLILPDPGNTAGVDVRGGAPGTRETDLLNPLNQVSEVSSIILSGGSAYGLEAASHLMKILEKEGIGFDVGVGIVPIISQAVLFDLAYKNPKARPDEIMTKKLLNLRPTMINRWEL